MYSKTTDDLIFTVPVAAGTNLSNYVTTNIGSMKNSGIELGLTARGARRAGGRRCAGMPTSPPRTTPTSCESINPVSGTAHRSSPAASPAASAHTIQVLQPGQPVNSFFVYRHKTGADGKPVTGNKTDIEMYVDQNGDGKINQDDRVAYKSPAPKWIIGPHVERHVQELGPRRSRSARYLGNYVYNNVASNLGTYRELTRQRRRTTCTPRCSRPASDQPQYFSDLYVEEASFLRLDNVSSATPSRTCAASRCGCSARSRTCSRSPEYSGVDPTAGVNGIDNNMYPLSRTFTTGLNVGF